MEDIPSFGEGVERFRRFLRDLGHQADVVWVFREDFYSVPYSRTWIRWPLTDANSTLATRCFEAGRGRGLVEIAALFRVGASIAATVFAPAPDKVQGWNQGFKLSVRSPLTDAVPVSNGLVWAVHRRRRAYAQFQKRDTFVHSRSVAA